MPRMPWGPRDEYCQATRARCVHVDGVSAEELDAGISASEKREPSAIYLLIMAPPAAAYRDVKLVAPDHRAARARATLSPTASRASRSAARREVPPQSPQRSVLQKIAAQSLSSVSDRFESDPRGRRRGRRATRHLSRRSEFDRSRLQTRARPASRFRRASSQPERGPRRRGYGA